MKKFLMISFLVMFFITGCLKNDKQEIIVHDVDISVKSISYLEVKEIIDTNNNPDVVSKAYKQALEQFKGAFEKVEFAIFCAEHETNNYLAFKKNIV